jgi:hypothetical protein
MAEKKTEQTEEPVTLEPITVRTTGAIRFCRAGQRFGRTARRLTEYTPEQLAAWQAEDYLIVDFD